MVLIRGWLREAVSLSFMPLLHDKPPRCPGVRTLGDHNRHPDSRPNWHFLVYWSNFPEPQFTAPLYKHIFPMQLRRILDENIAKAARMALVQGVHR